MTLEIRLAMLVE